MATLKLYGLRSAYDEVMATAIKRQHEPPSIVGNLLSADIAEMKHDFSGRDAHIIALALAYAIAAIDALSRQLAALSDQDDMKAMLDDMISQDSELARYIDRSRKHIDDLRL
jgi:hypothetical protein